jgi:hypothetical protein
MATRADHQGAEKSSIIFRGLWSDNGATVLLSESHSVSLPDKPEAEQMLELRV